MIFSILADGATGQTTCNVLPATADIARQLVRDLPKNLHSV